MTVALGHGLASHTALSRRQQFRFAGKETQLQGTLQFVTVLSTHLPSFRISIFAHLRRCSRCLVLCLFLGSWLVNKYKQMDCLTQQSIRTVRGQLCVSTLTSVMWNPIKWRAFSATYGPFHHVNNAMSSEIGAWLTSDWIVVDGPVDAQQGRSVMDTQQSFFLRP